MLLRTRLAGGVSTTRQDRGTGVGGNRSSGRIHALSDVAVLRGRGMERATWRTLMSELPIKRISGQVDWRAELGVVMGETARGVPAGTRGKSIDTFGPVGPAVPSSRLPDPQSRWLARRVDGMAVKDGVTADMVFG